MQAEKEVVDLEDLLVLRRIFGPVAINHASETAVKAQMKQHLPEKKLKKGYVASLPRLESCRCTPALAQRRLAILSNRRCDSRLVAARPLTQRKRQLWTDTAVVLQGAGPCAHGRKRCDASLPAVVDEAQAEGAGHLECRGQQGPA